MTVFLSFIIGLFSMVVLGKIVKLQPEEPDIKYNKIDIVVYFGIIVWAIILLCI